MQQLGKNGCILDAKCLNCIYFPSIVCDKTPSTYRIFTGSLGVVVVGMGWVGALATPMTMDFGTELYAACQKLYHLGWYILIL